MAHRKGHFMPTSLLESQLQTLEVPTGEKGVVTVDIDDTIEDIAAKALKALAALGITG
jgi:gluconokinase